MDGNIPDQGIQAHPEMQLSEPTESASSDSARPQISLDAISAPQPTIPSHAGGSPRFAVISGFSALAVLVAVGIFVLHGQKLNPLAQNAKLPAQSGDTLDLPTNAKLTSLQVTHAEIGTLKTTGITSLQGAVDIQGDLTSSGNVSARTFNGQTLTISGASTLANLTAANITATGSVTVGGTISAKNISGVFQGSFSGDGSKLTNLSSAICATCVKLLPDTNTPQTGNVAITGDLAISGTAGSRRAHIKSAVTDAFTVQTNTGETVLAADTLNNNVTIGNFLPAKPGAITVGSSSPGTHVHSAVALGNNSFYNDNDHWAARGPDGFMRFVYDLNNTQIDFVRCQNTACDQNVHTVVDTDLVNQFDSPAIALDQAGNAYLVYMNWTTPDQIKLVHCLNQDCTSSTSQIMPTSLEPDYNMAITVDGQNHANVVFDTFDSSTPGDTLYGLELVHCTNADCSTSDHINLEQKLQSNGGYWYETSAAATGPDGLAHFAYVDEATRQIVYVSCTTADCSSRQKQPLSVTDANYYVSFAIGSDNLAKFVYQTYDQNNGNTKVGYVACQNVACTSDIAKQISPLDTIDSPAPDIALTPSNTPMISSNVGGASYNSKDLGYIYCDDAACTNPVLTTVANFGNEYSSSIIATPQGLPQIVYSYYDNVTTNEGEARVLTFDKVDGTNVSVSGTFSAGTTIGSITNRFGTMYAQGLDLQTAQSTAALLVNQRAIFNENPSIATVQGPIADFQASGTSVVKISGNQTPAAPALLVNLPQATGTVSDFQASGVSKLTITEAAVTSLVPIVAQAGVQIGANASLQIVGSNTFPTGTEGALYYRTDQSQLYVYKGGNWSALGSGSNPVKIVASQFSQYASQADYTTTGSNDQTVINNALTALPENGTLVLMPGYYWLGAPIVLAKAHESLIGASSQNTFLVRSYDGTNYLDGMIQDTASRTQMSGFALLGQKILYANSNNNGLMINSNANGVILTDLDIEQSAGYGLFSPWAGTPSEPWQANGLRVDYNTLGGVALNTVSIDITGSDISYNGGTGLNATPQGSAVGRITNTTLTHNGGPGLTTGYEFDVFTSSISNNGNTGVSGLPGSVIEDSQINFNNGHGVYATNNSLHIRHSQITGNVADGIYVQGNDQQYIGNTFSGNGLSGIDFNGIYPNIIIDSNTFKDTGQDSPGRSPLILCGTSPRVTNNSFTEAVGNGYAIAVSNCTTNAYIANNTLSGAGAMSISDSGTATTIVGQSDGSGNIVNQAGGKTVLMQATNGQTADVLQATNSSGQNLMKVDVSGNMAISGDITTASLSTFGAQQTNYIWDPTFVTSLVGRGAGSRQAVSGYNSTTATGHAYKVTPNNDWTTVAQMCPLPSPGTYTMSFLAWTDSGSELVGALDGPGLGIGSITATTTIKRYSLTFVHGNYCNSFEIGPSGGTTPVYFADMQVEAGAVATPFIYGDAGPGYSWEGTPGSSNSVRQAGIYDKTSLYVAGSAVISGPVTASSGSVSALRIQGANSQNADVLQALDANGGKLLTLGAQGNLFVNGDLQARNLVSSAASSTNYVPDPVFQTALGGRGAGTRQLITNQTVTPSGQAVKITPSNDWTTVGETCYLSSAGAYTMSFTAWTSSGTETVTALDGPGTFVGSVTVSTTPSRFSITFTHPGSCNGFEIGPSGGTNAVYIADWQVEAGSTATQFFYGSLGAGYSWTGSTNASLSVRQGGLIIGSNIFANGNLAVNGHVITGNISGTTTAAPGGQAGTGGTCTVAGNDTSGTITLTTGTGPAAGTLCTVTFANAYGSAPRITVTPFTATGAAIQYYVGTTGTGTFTLSSGNAPAASTQYKYFYHTEQ